MSKGLLVVARNNRSLDYIKQASFLADRAKQILNLPTSIITDSVDYIEKQGWIDKFDNIITLVYSNDEYVAGSNVLSKYLMQMLYTKIMQPMLNLLWSIILIKSRH